MRFMMKSKKLKQVSLLGRIAYAIMCAEKISVEKYPDKDWKVIFEIFWKACDCEALDVWSWEIMEYIPKYLFEFKDFESADFEYIDKEKYLKLVEIYKGVDDSINQILLAIRNIEEEYAYSSIPEYGRISLEYIDEILAILEKNGVSPPDPQLVAFSKFCERDGWGEPFDGTKLSIVLKG